MKVGILGTGGMGNVHARQYRKMPDIQIGYRDRSPERGDSFAARWQANPCDSADELIAWADVVDICLPTDLHVDYALRAIAAGKPIFIEKPIAASIDDAWKIVNAAEEAGVPMMVGLVVRFFPEYAMARKMVLDGAVGKPAAVRTRRGGLAPSGHNEWFMDHSRSGGVLIDLAIHDFDWLRWTLGEVRHLFSRSVAATAGQGPDYALTTLSFENGAVAHVESTWMDPAGFRTTYEVAGSDGMIEFDSRNSASVRTHKTGSLKLESPLNGDDDPYYKELSAFLSSVANGTPPPVTGRDGIAALTLSLAALESARTGQVVRPARI